MLIYGSSVIFVLVPALSICSYVDFQGLMCPIGPFQIHPTHSIFSSGHVVTPWSGVALVQLLTLGVQFK